MRHALYSLKKEEFTVEELGNLFDKKFSEWNHDLQNENSEMYRMVTTLPDCSPNSLDVRSLILLCILWCDGEDIEKADALFSVLNPPGQSQISIAFNDKDWDDVMKTLFWIATGFTYSLNSQPFDENILRSGIEAMIYNEDDDNEKL